MKSKVYQFVFLATLLLATNVSAQIFKPRTNEPRPKAILVELKTEKRKIDYYAAKHPDLAMEIQEEAAHIRQVMINDFRDHFAFCPVYFFIDTNIKYIMDRKFDGVLFDVNGSSAKNIVLTSQDTNYYIMQFGNALANPKPEKVQGNMEQDASYLLGRGLVAYDYQLHQLPNRHHHYVWKMDWWEIFGKPNYKYGYKSKKYNMEYFPEAKGLNKYLSLYFDKVLPPL